MTHAPESRQTLRSDIVALARKLRIDALERGKLDEALAYGRVLDDVLCAAGYDQGGP